MPKVGIVISNYNGWQDTLVCLDSLQKQTYKDFEIILLDDKIDCPINRIQDPDVSIFDIMNHVIFFSQNIVCWES